MQKTIIFVLALLICTIQVSNSIDCLNQNGDSVSWAAMVNFPGKTQTAQPASDRKYYIYYGADTNDQTSFTLGDNFIDQSGSAFYNTISQLNNNQLEIVAWDDGDPNNSTYSWSYGHTKGILALDLSTQQGIFIAHSFPNYPTIVNGEIAPPIQDPEKVYGQSYICMTVDQDALETITGQIIMQIPRVFYTQNLSPQTPNIQSLGQIQNMTQTQLNALTSSQNFTNGQFSLRTDSTQIQFFTKAQKNMTTWIFSSIMAQTLQVNLLAETWGRPWQAPICNDNGYYITNIQDIQVNENIYWSSYDDHSKWTISSSSSSPWVCIGDMNRMTSQEDRGGSYYCQQNANLWSAFNSLVYQYDESCSSSMIQNKLNQMKQKQFISYDIQKN